MKKLYKYIVLVIGILAFSACTDEIEFSNVVDEGSDVTLKLNVKAHAKNNVIVGRAADDEILYDLHFYVFDQYGNLTGHTPVTGTSLTSPNGSVSITAKTGKSYIYAVANIDQGVYYTISSTDKQLLNNPDGDTKLTLTKLKEIKFNRTISKDNNLLSPKPEDKFYMMSGYINDGNLVNIKQDGVFNEEGEEINTVNLYRIVAKNTLHINTFSTELDEYEKDENGNNVLDEKGNPVKKKLYKGKFTPKSYRLCNVPKGGVLIPNTNISTTSQYLKKTKEDGTVTDNITEDETESSYFENSLDSVFTFYYPENLQVAKTAEEVSACQQNIEANDRVNWKENWVWKDRETNKWNTEGTVKQFVFADDNAAYIEIEGSYEYQGEGENYNANVTYTIHLGDFSTNIKDFNVIRNCNYTYNVIINGVEDIIAEATKDDEGKSKYDNPYAEGLVVRTTTGEHYDVDAHYEARVMAFNMAEIKKLKDDGYGYFLNIATPFSEMDGTMYVKNNGVYSFPEKDEAYCAIHEVESRFSKEDLFGWVRFVENGANQVDPETGLDVPGTSNAIMGPVNTHVCKYPGDEKKKYSYPTGDNGTIVRETKCEGGWMNAFELLEDLYEKANNNNGIVYYTCFIDENYYAGKDWIEYVNKQPRTIQIANKLSISPDGKSVYADVAYSVSQRSIATFYQDTNLKAFGTEIIDEEDKYSKDPYNYEDVRMGEEGSVVKYTIFPPSTTNADNWNGYTNAVTTNKDRNWYDHTVNGNQLVQNYPNTQPLYAAVGKACMSRNRDNDGDGSIDSDEVRWYLASVEQYHALYIAQESLPAESKLISDQDLRTLNDVDYSPNWDQSGHDIRGKYHYYTSSARTSAGTYWPEEGMTNNGLENSTTFMQRAELVRCVRTLQSGTTTNKGYGLQAPDKYYKFNKESNKPDYYIFDLSGIKTRRTAMPVLANHNELQPLNELSPLFEVAKESLYKDEVYKLDDLTSKEYDPCSTYSQEKDSDGNPIDHGTWRTPNQKEVALMLAEIPSEMKARRHGTRTRFSASITDDDPYNVSWHGPYNWHYRYAFSVETSGKFNVTGNDFMPDNTRSVTNVDIRCVRDVAPRKVTNVSLSPTSVELESNKTVTLTFVIIEGVTFTINAHGLIDANSETGTIINNADGTINYTPNSSDTQTITFKTKDAVCDGIVTISCDDIVQSTLTFSRNWGTKDVSNGNRNYRGDYTIKVGTTTIGSCSYEYQRNTYSRLNNIRFNGSYDGTLDNNTSITITNGTYTISTTIGNLINGTGLRFN